MDAAWDQGKAGGIHKCIF